MKLNQNDGLKGGRVGLFFSTGEKADVPLLAATAEITDTDVSIVQPTGAEIVALVAGAETEIENRLVITDTAIFVNTFRRR